MLKLLATAFHWPVAGPGAWRNGHGVVKGRESLPRAKVPEYFAQVPPCLIEIEACASAHYWAQALGKPAHMLKLMAAQFVIPDSKRGKNDANDAEAICGAVGRLMVRRARTLVAANRTAPVNQIRGLLGEFALCWCQRAWRGFVPSYHESSGNAENGLPGLAHEVLTEQAVAKSPCPPGASRSANFRNCK